MKKLARSPFLYAILTLGMLFGQAAHAGIITKLPDRGPFWNPLSTSGTYIYADSFVAPDSGSVTSLGLWLLRGPANLVFQVYGSLNGDPASGPDTTNVIATTALIAGGVYDELTFISNATVSSLLLNAGQVYWFGASTVGTPAVVGQYTVGSHTQNSIYQDNGTFWYSNDPAGILFDGTALTPEMAFQVVTSTDGRIPAPATLMLVFVGLATLGFTRAKRVAD